MKLHRIELEGFGPYRERQSVDFDAFADDGIFLIAGRTGAGKSSILDGVCFALYGGVPRYDGVDKRLRSDHCAPDDITEVVLEFTVAGARWRATRAPEYERPKRRGGGVTTEAARAQLDELVDGRWQGRAAGPRDVALALDEILGLNQQQFLQVILLAQNRFQRFLLARNDERQALLRTLFGTRTYEEYERALDQRRKIAETAVAAGTERIAVHLAEAEDLVADHGLAGDETSAPNGHDERIAYARRAAERAAYRAEVAMVERDAAQAAHRVAEAASLEALAVHRRLQQRQRSRAALDALLADEEAIAADRGTLERALQAETLRASVEATERAEATVVVAADAEAAARAAWLSAGEDAVDATELARVTERLVAELALAGAAAHQEDDLRRAEQASQQAAQQLAAFEAALADLDQRCAALPAERRRVDAALAEAAVGAAALDTALGTLERVRAQRDAAAEAEAIQAAARTAEQAYAARSAELGLAVSAVTDLLRRRLAGYAAELAAELVDGSPCAVCGSTEHPLPASGHDDAVDDASIASAESARDAAIAAEREAGEGALAARRAHAAAAARAGGSALADLEAASTRAQAAVDAAEESARLRVQLAAVRDELDALLAAADLERTSSTSAIATAGRAAAVAAARVERLRADVAEARGAYTTVGERVDDLTRRRDLARALLAAMDEHEVRIDARRDAGADCEARVTASVFDSTLEAIAALRNQGARTALDARIRAHETALHTERDKLRELELSLAGADESVDVEASQAAVESAREASDTAMTQALRATDAAQRLRRCIERATAARAQIAELADEHTAIGRLADTVAGRAPNTHRMTLETFVLAAELEEIVAAAGRRLHEMSSGRYRLAHTDARAARNAASGLGIEVLDSYTGQARPAQSLSGGETFLASLALALGLAEVVTNRAGGLRLDTLFIDEGFGSLDAETLDLAMTTLDELRQGGRTVGVISHVEAMKEQLPAQLVVEATSTGASVIRQGVGALV